MENKKGQLQIVALIIGIIAAAIVVGNVLFDQVDNFTEAQTDSDVIVHTINSTTVHQLEKAGDGLTIETGSVSIPGLTAGTNYTVSYSAGNVTINDTTATGNYTATYDYFEATYVSDSSNRTLMNLVILFAIIGLVFAFGRGFGLI